MTRLAADFDTPYLVASWRSVRLVRQLAATSSTRSSNASLHCLALRSGSAPLCRNVVISQPSWRGLSPVNGAVQDGSEQ